VARHVVVLTQIPKEGRHATRISCPDCRSFGICGAAFAQVAPTDPQTLQAILTEVRALRQELRISSLTRVQSTQICFSRLQMQQGAVARASEHLDEARSKLAEITSPSKGCGREVKRLEDARPAKRTSSNRRHYRTGSTTSNPSSKSQATQKQQRQATEIQAEQQQLRAEQDKLSGQLETQLDERYKAWAIQSNSPVAIGPDPQGKARDEQRRKQVEKRGVPPFSLTPVRANLLPCNPRLRHRPRHSLFSQDGSHRRRSPAQSGHLANRIRSLIPRFLRDHRRKLPPSLTEEWSLRHRHTIEVRSRPQSSPAPLLTHAGCGSRRPRKSPPPESRHPHRLALLQQTYAGGPSIVISKPLPKPSATQPIILYTVPGRTASTSGHDPQRGGSLRRDSEHGGASN